MDNPIIAIPTHKTVCRMIPTPDGAYRIVIDAIVSANTAIEVMKVLGLRVEWGTGVPDADRT